MALGLLVTGQAQMVHADPAAPALSGRGDRNLLTPPVLPAQTRRTCQDMRSCREAVILWCDGYSRADADRDGIPCENVCSTREEVEVIQAEIGC